MLATERKNLILEELQENKKVVVSVLSEKFGVSEETIRRDLDKLEKEGICIKEYGGAVLKENIDFDMPFSARKKKNLEGKKIIGEILSKIIGEGEHIFFDASTTAIAILNEIREKKITVITNSLAVLLSSTDDNEWAVISTGGKLDKEYMALVGPNAVSSISTMNADKVILSCKGLDMERGLTDANELFSQVKQNMIRSSKMKILAVDYTKFENVAFSHICNLADIDMVVTDRKPSREWLKHFEDKGIECLYCEQLD